MPADTRRELGFDLRLVESGQAPRDWRPMPTVGPAVNEIRVRVRGAYRVLYVARFGEAIYVLHAFEKKSRKTAQLDLDLARARYRALVRTRKER